MSATDWCPSCSSMTISKGVCVRCKRDFHVRIFRGDRRTAARVINDLPMLRECNPFRIDHEFRDSKWRKLCGFTTRRGRSSL